MQPAPLQRLLYLSTVRLGPAGPDKTAAIRTLGARAARRNRTQGLTGLLCHVDDTFIQVIEGPEAEIEAVFDRICCDFRHDGIRVVDVAPVSERLFGDWSMAVLRDTEQAPDTLRPDLEDIRFLAGNHQGEAASRMRDLLATYSAFVD